MRKISVILSLILLAFFAVLPSGKVAFAEQSNEISTEIFLPTSYLQYYKLDNPYALYRYIDDEGEEVIAISHKNAIVIYRNEKFSSIPLALGDNQVKSIGHFGKYLLYVFELHLRAIDMTDFNSPDWKYEDHSEETNVTCDCFSVCKNILVTSNGDNVKFSEIDETSDKFECKEGYLNTLQATKAVNLLYTENEKLYYDSANNSSVYVYDGNEVTEIFEANGSVRCLAGDDENIFFTTDKGIYSYSGGEVKTIKETDQLDEDDLGSIKDPIGICPISGDKLWVVDGKINAVQEIDLSDNSFTPFAITTNSKAINRLSGEVKDLCIDEDKIYALDGDRIVVINNVGGVNTYNRIVTEENIDLFAVGGEYVCYSKGNIVKLLKISDVETPDLAGEELFTKDLAEITDITFVDGEFAILTNKVVGGEVFPSIYTLTADGTLNELAFNAPAGKGVRITADVFGVKYFVTETDNRYNFYSLGDETKLIASEEKTSSLLKIQTDFDGKIFALYSDNELKCFDESGRIYSKTLSLSENIKDVGDALSMCLSYNYKTAFFLFGGLILNSSPEQDILITTPSSVTFPNDFSVNSEQNYTFAHIKDNSKLFTYDLASRSYGECITFNDEDSVFVRFPITEKYSLVLSDSVSAIVRTPDAFGDYKPTENKGKCFALVGFKIYSIPILAEEYAIGNVEKHAFVSKVSETEFNGVKYFAVVSEEGKIGFIPQSFVASELSSDLNKHFVTTAYAYSRYGVNVFSDEEMKEKTDVLTSKTQITVLEKKNGVLKIEYGEKYGYISEKDLYSDSSAVIVKAIAVVLVALSLLVVSLFLISKFLYGKERNRQ